MNKRCYTLGITANVAAAGGTGNVDFSIRNIGRTFLLKSIIFDIRLWMTGSNIPIPVEQNTTQEYMLTMYKNIVNIETISDLFNMDAIGGGVAVENGITNYIHKRGQYFYDSFPITDYLIFYWRYINRDAINGVSFYAYIRTEIEDINVL